MIDAKSVYDTVNELWVDSQSDWNKIEIRRFHDMLNNTIVSASPNTFYKNNDDPSNKLNPVRALFTPVRMWVTQNGCYTTVEWSDGTKTTARAEDAFSTDPYYGFCACVVKKLYGSTTKAMKLMQSADEKAKEPAKKRKEERERIKKERQLKTERARDIREKRIQMLMDEIYVKREADRRVHEADERSESEQ